MFRRIRSIVRGAFLLLLFLPLRDVHAQSPPDSLTYYLGPVTSIGTRTAEPWIQVPMSTTLLPFNGNFQGRGYGLDEALANVPGVLVQSRSGNQDVRISIRGFGARGAGERSNAGTSRGIRILNNGFPDTEPDGRTSFDLVDLGGAGAIEVVRSNASSVYGNASGGVINIQANTLFASPFAAFTESMGSFGFRKEMVNAGVMLGQGRMYFSLSNTNADGWRAQSRSSQMLLNTGIVGPVGEHTTLGVHLAGTSNIFRIPGPLSQAQYDADPSQSDQLYVTRDERRFNRLGRLGITVSHDIDEHNSLSAATFVQPKYLQRSERGTFRDFNRYHIGGSAVYSNVTAWGGNRQNTFLAGADEAYQDGAILFYNLTALSGRGTLRDNKREGANNFGAFIQDQFETGDQWIILAGARYDNITYYSESFINPDLSDTKSFEKVTPKFGLTYKLSPTHSVYANYGGGVEAPAGNETDPAGTFGLDTVYAINPLLEPISSTTIEVGTKQILSFGESFAAATLTYDLALYWLQVTNDIIPYRNGRFYFTAGKTERMGGELGASLAFPMGLSISASLSASSNKYREYMVDSVHYSAARAGVFADYADNKVVGIPDLFYSAEVKYAATELHGLYVRFNLQSVGKYFADDRNTITVPSYAVLNAGIGITRLPLGSDILYLNAFVGVNNLTDAKYVGSAWLNPDIVGGAPVFIEPGLPRNVVGQLALGVNL